MRPLMNATVIGEQKKANLDNRLSASATAMEAARNARAELEAEVNKHPRELRVLSAMSLYTHIRFCVLLAASLLLVSQPAWATKRVALVVGNSSYQNAHCFQTRP